MRPEEQSTPSSDLSCILCRGADETKTTGPLSCKQGIAAHQNCLLYASGIYCKNSPIFDELFGFDVTDVKEESRRGKKLKCAHCKQNGATAGCEVRSCKRSYHYPCARKAHAITDEDENNGIFRLYCNKHNPRARNDGSEEGDAMVTPSGSGHQRPETNEQDSSHWGSEPISTPLPASPGPSCSLVSSSSKLKSPSCVLLFPLSDSETSFARRSQYRKRKLQDYSSDSDETDPGFPPVESESEGTPPKQNKQQTLDSEDRSRNNKKTRQEAPNGGDDDDEAYRDSDVDSQSLLQPEFCQVLPLTVIADSGPSIESVAENSPDTMSPASPGPADTASSNLDQSVSATKQAAVLRSDITVAVYAPVPPRPSLDSPPSGATGKSSTAEEAPRGDLLEQPVRCASRDLPPLQMKEELPEPHIMRLHDNPLDLRAPGVCCEAPVQHGKPAGRAGVSDSSAAVFWRRCNEVGCTKTIFTGLTRQLASLAEKVQNQHATQQEYAVSLRMLEASGKLPAIFRQMEQDLEDQERQLQRKREALRDAKAALDKNQLLI